MRNAETDQKSARSAQLIEVNRVKILGREAVSSTDFGGMVEAAGIEPASRGTAAKASTLIVGLLYVAS